MECQQCLSPRGEIAEYRVFSDVINVEVCRRCAEKARALGLKTTPLRDRPERRSGDHKHAA